MKKHLKSIIVLFSICAVVALLLALTNYFTAPVIKDYEEEIARQALLEVLPGAKKFTLVDLPDGMPEIVEEAHKADIGGYVFKLRTSGYKSDMIIMCGINPDGTISKAKCISSNETLGYEKTYGENFNGLDANGVNSVNTIANATSTTTAYKNAIKDALNAFNILEGGAK